MDATAIFNNLLDHNAAKRVEVLIVMRKLVRNNNPHLPFRNMSKEAVFEILAHVLDDVRWEVRYQCLLLIAAIVQNSEDEVDSYMLIVMPKVICNLGHENTNIRRAALQVLHMHMKYTTNLHRFLKMFIQHGLESQEYVTRKGCITSIGILFTSEFANENLGPLVESLARHIVHDDASLFYLIFLAMQKISELVGSATFESYLMRLDREAVNTYKRVLSKFYLNDTCLRVASASHAGFSGNLNEKTYASESKVAKYEYGIFDSHIIENIQSKDWKTRIEGVEHMKIILRDTPDLVEQILDVDKFLIFLSSLLCDSNFKIVLSTLSIYDLLIDKFRKEIKRFLRTFISAVLKHLGDPKLVVREHAVKVIHKLMHHVKPSDVLSNLLESKSHRNPRLREEIVNRVTAAVLTFPSYSIEFSVLCEAVAPLLIDSKRRVRLAALECFAVLAQAMGPTRLIPLVAAVDGIELNFDGEGLMTAIQARLARRILPKCTEDGSITYAVTIPSSAGNNSRTSISYGADIDWIMAASGSSSSSTPPSRSKETAWREPSASVSKPKVLKSKSDDLICISKTEDELFSTSEEDNNLPFLYKNVADSASLRRNSSYDDQTMPAIIPCIKGSDYLNENAFLSKIKQNSDSVKPRTGVHVSRIPVLTRKNSIRRNLASEENYHPIPSMSCLRSPCRVRGSTPPLLPRQFLNSATHLNSDSDHNYYDGEIFKLGVIENGNGIVLRKVSPSSSALRRKPILVRSPSLSQLHQLPQWDSQNSDSCVTPDPPPPPTKAMGNIGSYFHTSQDGVIMTQPAPIHLDNVNDINVIVLDDSVKVPSSPSPQSWPSAELFHPPGSGGSCKNSGRNSPAANSMPDVYSIRRNSHYSAPASINQDSYTTPLNGLDCSSISISKITREKMLKRQQEILREAEERRIARERSQQEHKQLLEKRLLEEKERQLRYLQQQQLQQASSTDEDTAEEQCEEIESAVAIQEETQMRPSSVKPSTPPAKATPTPTLSPAKANSTPSTPSSPPSPTGSMKRRISTSESKNSSARTLSRSSSLKISSANKRPAQSNPPQSSVRNLTHMSKRNFAASSLALYEDSQNNASSFPNPNEALKKALKSMSTETWMGKIEGIQTISRLAQTNPDVLLPHLHAVNLALLSEVKNLRSSVSRSAILAVGHLFSALKRNMEQDLDLVASTLLSKSGETVGFIRDDIEKVMKLLIEAVTPNKAALSIIYGGASHRNGAVRKTAAHALLGVVEKMGAARILTTARDVTEKLLPITAQFLMDGTPLTRYYGRRIFEILLTHPSFDKLLLKYVQPSTLRNINSILDNVRKKGAGDMPKEKVSACTNKNSVRRSLLLNRTM